jgi:serine/threonine-protein kinase HipA
MSENGEWRLSPAYDITYSEGPNGHHWTGYAGEALNPGMDDLLKIAKAASIDEKNARLIIERVKDVVSTFKRIANENGVPLKIADPIVKRMNFSTSN